ncbi:helix-turn-helix transcriptional regulator [Sinorhizobium alkalisoli]|uniref:AraC family transcriptional regulator n=1 Tax=Sinorhizobium alkalisoli TaxID=1752398 RepID=A0A1E3VI98_9HYPH|nr:AraC family transcriptional regulator [Sinorhizobium alkalisoli]MCG5480370.1 AraC family transcriptional regulator [Sinorhizobium alkalisoli]ODR93264.1 AraC family transcriptional regulator [Sinorhizobium alkalisoli]
MTSESGSGDDPTDAPSWPEAKERRRWPREPATGKGSRPSGPPALVPLRFSTGELPSAAQFAAWRAHMAPLLDVRLPDGVSPDQGFPAEQTGWRLNDLLIVQQRTPAHSYARSRAMLRSSPIDHWSLGILQSGRAWTEVDRRVTETAPGDLFLRSLGYPYRGRTTEAAGVFLFMSYELLADDAGILEVANNSVLSGSLADLLLNYINGIEASLGVLRAEELPRIVQTMRDMVVSCVAASVTPSPAGAETNKGMMERAHRYIHLHLNSAELTPDAICRAVGISRTRLYQLFEQSGGVLNYIRKRRLQHAYAALSDPTDSRSIAEIAEAAGFDVAANFTRAFSHEFGLSPREIRKAAATHRPILAVTPTRRNRGATIGDWLDPPGR